MCVCELMSMAGLLEFIKPKDLAQLKAAVPPPPKDQPRNHAGLAEPAKHQHPCTLPFSLTLAVLLPDVLLASWLSIGPDSALPKDQDHHHAWWTAGLLDQDPVAVEAWTWRCRQAEIIACPIRGGYNPDCAISFCLPFR